MQQEKLIFNWLSHPACTHTYLANFHLKKALARTGKGLPISTSLARKYTCRGQPIIQAGTVVGHGYVWNIHHSVKYIVFMIIIEYSGRRNAIQCERDAQGAAEPKWHGTKCTASTKTGK